MAETKKETVNFNTHWFWAPVIACRRIYLQVIAASILINIFALASSLYIMTVYDRVIPNGAMESLWALTIIMIVIMAFDITMKIIRGSFVDVASARIDRVVSDRLFHRIARFDVSLSRQATGALSNMVREFEVLKEVLGSASFVVFADLPFIFLFLTVLYAIGGPVAAIPGLIVPAVILFGILLQPIMKRFASLGMVQGQSKQAVIVEMLSGLETLKTIPGVSLLRTRWLKSVVNQSNANQKMRFSGQLTQYVTQLGQQISQVGIVVYGVILITAGNLTMGQLIACVILSGRCLAPLGQVTQLLGKFNHALAAYRNLDMILKGESDEEIRANRVKREHIKGDIAIQEVSFAYEGQENNVLEDINLTVNAGERVAILGSIGSGKTTLLRLIAGLQKAKTGHILMDNADIQQIRPEDIRNNIGIVFQQPILFSGTIRENLLMGDPEASDADLIAATTQTGADKFIGRLPGGFDFTLSEGGKELSAGMRQSLAIARALINKPSVLLMDEPTASMDARTEFELVNTLNEATKDMTVIFVTHRGALQNIADRIVIMEAGRITINDKREDVLARMRARNQPAIRQIKP